MENKKVKYDGRGSHRRALLHAIGQLEEISGGATVREAARFMNVSKPTAQRYLKAMESNGEIYSLWEDYRSNCGKRVYFLKRDVFHEYVNNAFSLEFKLFASMAHGVRSR